MRDILVVNLIAKISLVRVIMGFEIGVVPVENKLQPLPAIMSGEQQPEEVVMKIRFIAKILPKTLPFYIKQEGIGWRDFDSHATLSEDGRIWQTAMSNFEYELLEESDDTTRWEYRGAESDFLQQNLLPPIELVEIQSVEGTYGRFTAEGGADPLGRYHSCKEGLYGGPGQFRRVYDALEIVGVFRHNGWKRAWFAAEVFKRHFREGSESTDSCLLNSAILKRAYWSLFEHSPARQSDVFRGEGEERSTRKISFPEFCYLVGRLRKGGVCSASDLLQL